MRRREFLKLAAAGAGATSLPLAGNLGWPAESLTVKKPVEKPCDLACALKVNLT